MSADDQLILYIHQTVNLRMLARFEVNFFNYFLRKNKSDFTHFKKIESQRERKNLIGMEEIKVTHTITQSHTGHIETLFCRSVIHARYLYARKFVFVRIFRDRTKENSFYFTWITSYNDRTTKECLYVTDVTRM